MAKVSIMSKEIVQGIFTGLVAIIICVTIGSLVAQHVVASNEAEEGGAAQHQKEAPAAKTPAKAAEKPAAGKK